MWNLWKRWTIGGLAALFLVPLAGSAQEPAAGNDHVVDGERVRATMAEKADRAEQQRELVRSILEHPEVETVAGAHGVDLTRVRDAVSTLDGDELSRVAAQAEQVETALVGGDTTVVISTTAIIIGLLVLIIILVS